MKAKYDYGDKDFFGTHDKTSYAASVIVDLIMSAFPDIESVIDVGCGVGTWLFMFLQKGVLNVKGIEGTWLKDDFIVIPKDLILRQDLNRPIVHKEKYDLAVSLEVCEHLEPNRAEPFVNELCGLANIVLFSGAVPGQMDKSHRNEQWPDYWSEKFKSNGFSSYDFIRWNIWGDDSIPYWYRQNCILFAKDGISIPSDVKATFCDRPPCVVHPEFMEKKLDISFGQGICQRSRKSEPFSVVKTEPLFRLITCRSPR